MTDPSQAFTPDDLFNEHRIEDLDLASGGQGAVIEVKTIRQNDGDYLAQLWLVPTAPGSAPRRLTTVPGQDKHPRWSPQGDRIAFSSARHGGAPQVYLIHPDGGEAQQLTHLGCTVVDFVWRPDGRQLALVCAVNVDVDRRKPGTEEIDLDRAPAPSHAPQVAWRLPYKMDGAGYTLGARMHLVLFDLDSATTTPLTRGDFDVGKLAWSPDGRRIAFTRSRDGTRDNHCTDLWCLDATTGQPFPEAKRLSTDVATASSPAWSPDGQQIAFMGAIDPGDAILRLWRYDFRQQRVDRIGDDDLEVYADTLHWRKDNRTLVFIQPWRGVQRISAIDMQTAQVRVICEPPAGQVSALVMQGDQIAYIEEGVDHPIELHLVDADSGQSRQLTDFNAWWRERRSLRVQRRPFQVPDGRGGQETIEGWFLTAGDGAPAGPLLVDVHGGPAAYVMLKYPTTPHWQTLVAQGWSVLALNAVGSASYGGEFADRLRTHWGELDLPQVLAAVRTLQDEGLADDRVAISGSSYGGYFSAYAIGNSRVFRAAMVSAPVGNLETHYGTSDSGYYADPFSLQGKPDVSRDLMVRLSPMAHITQAVTPTLFLQGEEDERCPKCQSEEMFVKLQRCGVATELVIYPGGDHHTIGKGRPSHRIDAIRRIVQWLTHWVEVPLPPEEFKEESQAEGKDDRSEQTAPRRVRAPAAAPVNVPSPAMRTTSATTITRANRLRPSADARARPGAPPTQPPRPSRSHGRPPRKENPMPLNIFDHRGHPLERQQFTWRDMVQTPISKLDDDAYTRVRIILMNGIEREAQIFSHSCARMNRALQPVLAQLRRVEQHQATTINWLIGADHSPLETTIAYEQVAIDVTAGVALREPDSYLAQVYRFGLLEDFDHLYRYSALLDRLEGKDANNILQSYTDILPGRPTQVEHRHPLDDLRNPYDRKTAAPLSKLHALTIMAAEQQTHNYYMTIGPLFADPVARLLYESPRQSRRPVGLSQTVAA